jgi:ABC-type sulfate/molybdate transport systems ATPase subunit/ABC-type sulfate transport system permease component
VVGGGAKRTPLPWLGALLVIYLAVPLAAFAVRFIRSPSSGFSTPGLISAFYISIVSATISLVIIASLGIPLAYLLARSRSRLAAVIGVVVQLPLALPPLMSGILLIYILGPYTTLGRLFDGRLTESFAGVVFAQTFVSAPFLIVTARAAFSSVDQGLLDVAATLGHPELSRFWRVAVPVASPGIRAGMLLAWLRAFGEYGAVVIVSYHPFSIPVYTFNQFSSTGLPNTIAPTALSLAVALLAVVLSRIRLRHLRVAPAVLPEPVTPASSKTMPVSFDLDHHVGTFQLKIDHRAQGSTLAILGPSGSGKSSLLRCLAGLNGAEPGPVLFGEVPVAGLAAERRRVGYVAQGFSLFPHLTVRQQVLFATDANPGVAAYWLGHLHLDGLEDRLPDQLSGGQRQRVALAQALSRAPDVLLLDEPFAALDTPVRHELRRVLRRLQRETGLSTVLVTHDPDEAALLADEVIVIRQGHALQSGTRSEVFTRPASPEVARLLGIANLHHGTVGEPGHLAVADQLIEADTGNMVPGTPILWSIRPERVTLIESGGLDGTLVDIADVGTAVDLFVAVAPGLELQVRATQWRDFELGDPCHLALPSEAITVWRADPALSAQPAARSRHSSL